MLYDYVYPSNKVGRMYIAGNYVESPTYLFENRTGDTAVNLIACPDVEMGEASATIANVQNAVAKLGTSPAYVILNGNVHYVQYNDLTNLINVSVAYGAPLRPIADTTTTGRYPASRARETFFAAHARASSVATDVPPNFCINIRNVYTPQTNS
jgi:hypothetical protein